jgi:hypothetical protein
VKQKQAFGRDKDYSRPLVQRLHGIKEEFSLLWIFSGVMGQRYFRYLVIVKDTLPVLAHLKFGRFD